MALLVVGAEQVTSYPSGRQIPTPTARPLVQLLHQAERTFGKEGTIIIRRDALGVFDLPAQLPRRAVSLPALSETRDAGWRGTVQLASPWLNLYKQGAPTVHVLIWPYAKSGEIIETGSLVKTLERLHQFHHQLGAPYHTSPGVTGVSLLLDVYAPMYKGAPEWAPTVERKQGGKSVKVPAWEDVPPARKDCHPEDVLRWRNAVQPAGSLAWIFDANRARLRYAGTVKLARGMLQHMRDVTYSAIVNRKLCGYVRISRPSWNVAGFPHPGGYRPETAQHVVKVNGRQILTEWVSVPTLDLLMEVAEQGYIDPPQIWEGWLAPGSTLLRRWADALEAAYRLAAPLRPVVKEIYRGFSGQLRRGSKRLDRPDWYHTWIAEERCRLWRKWWAAYQAGHEPWRIETDAVWYPSDNADWCTAMPRALDLGDGLGQFHPIGAWLLGPAGAPITDDEGDPLLIEWSTDLDLMQGRTATITDHILEQQRARGLADVPE